MKNIFLVMMGLILIVGMVRLAPAQVAPSMYTLDDIYFYISDGTTATEGGHSLEPPSNARAGDTRFKTLEQIYDRAKWKFDYCDTTAADVESGKVFFSTDTNCWGAQIGTASFGIGLGSTGQSRTYWIGDDAYYHKGRKNEFEDNDDGTVTDHLTGLMWAKEGHGPGCARGNTLSWDDAINWSNSLVFAGSSNWRLPNATELQTLIIYDVTIGPPYINSTLFPETEINYWTETVMADDTTVAYFVGFTTGWCAPISKTREFYVRAVR